MALHKELAGRLLQVDDKSDLTIWLVDTDGSRRGIPNPQTYHNLFHDGVVELVPPFTITDIDESPLKGLSDGAILAKAPKDPTVYLITNNQKRGVTSPKAFDKFHFSWDQVQTVPAILLSSIPSGPLIGE